MPERPYDEMKKDRGRILAKATEDAKRWCVAPKTLVGNRRSEQFWIDEFLPGNIDKLIAPTVHQFLNTFQLTNRVLWDLNKVVEVIKGLVYSKSGEAVESAEAVKVIALLAENLRCCNKGGTRQVSAASKITMFAKPHLQVFIWDALAARSARARNWDRDGRKTLRPPKSVFKNYQEHHAACTKALEDERKKCDFPRAVNEVNEFLKTVGGPMADQRVVPAHFVERRVLDKLMFWEGCFMRGDDLGL